MDPREEQRLLDESLKKALDEAWAKANAALEEVSRESDGYERSVWMAMESADYASLLFSLTNNVEDARPHPAASKNKATLALVKESVAAFGKLIAPGKRDKMEDYSNLRKAVQNLQQAHLDLVKKGTGKGQNLTR
jgi:hypothetical protein